MKKRLLPKLLAAILVLSVLSSDISVFAFSDTTVKQTEVFEGEFVDESAEELYQLETISVDEEVITEENTIKTESVENSLIESETEEVGEIEVEEVEIVEKKPNFSNLILLVQFSDTGHIPAYTMENMQVFYGDEQNPDGMCQYLYALSENTLRVENILPQYDVETEEFSIFTLDHTAEYYDQNEEEMIEEIVSQLNSAELLEEEMILHYGNEESYLDWLTVVVPCETEASNVLFKTKVAEYMPKVSEAGENAETVVQETLKIGEDTVKNYQIVTETDLCYTEEAYLFVGKGIAEYLELIEIETDLEESAIQDGMLSDEEQMEESEIQTETTEIIDSSEVLKAEASLNADGTDLQEDVLTGLQTVDEKCYMYDDNGELLSGYFEYNGQKYYADNNGVLQSGWIKLGDVWRYFDSANSYCEVDSKTTDNYWFYLSDGRISYFDKKNILIQNSWKTISKQKYYFDDNGFVVKGWHQDGSYWYYGNENGQMVQGVYTIVEGKEAKNYYFDSNYRLSTGWKKIDGIYRYFNTDENSTKCNEIIFDQNTGWATSINDDRKCYIDKENGAIKGWKTIGGHRYHFDSNGFIDTGIFQDGKYHYFAETKDTATEKSPIGNVVKGVRKIGDFVYGFHSSKYYRLDGWQTLSGQRYYFTDDYHAVTGWYKEGNYWYYAEAKAESEELQLIPEGAMAKGEKKLTVISENGEPIERTYYFDSNYRLKTGWIKINNVWRYFAVGNTPEECYEITCEKDSGWMTITDGAETKKSYVNSKNSLLKGWQTINKKKYYFDNDGFVRTGLHKVGKYFYYADENGCTLKGSQMIDGITYHFDSEYRMKTGWLTVEGNKYYYDSNGNLLTGWFTVGSKKYYADEQGILQEDSSTFNGWKEIEGQKYYFDSKGQIQKGLKTIEGQKYYFDTKGVMQTGWITAGKRIYFANKEGIIEQGRKEFKGWKEIEGKTYYFNSKSEVSKGFQTISEQRFYFDSNGVLKSGWFEINGKYYYGAPAAKDDGTLKGSLAKGAKEIMINDVTGETATYVFHSSKYYRLTGFQSSGGKRYYLKSNGEARTGWFTVGTDLFYAQPDTNESLLKGTLASGATEIQNEDGTETYFFHTKSNYRLTGWQTISKKRYYLNSDGTARTGWFTIGGKVYYGEPETTDNGILKGTVAKGVREIAGETYVFHSDKYYRLTGWQTVAKKKYYLDADGTARTGWFKVAGKWYYAEPEKTESGTLKGTLAVGFKNLNYQENEESVERIYYFDSNYRLVTGWKTISKKTYFFNKDTDPEKCYQICQGPSKKGWFTFEDGRKSYLDSKGKFVTGWQTIAKKKYYFDSSAIMQTGWCTISGKDYYFNSDGVYIPLITPSFTALTSTDYKAVDISWKEISGAKSYILQYSKDKTFPSWKTVSVSITDTMTTKYRLENMEGDERYYFRLKYTVWGGDEAYPEVTISAYSNVKDIVVRGEVAPTATSAVISDCQIISGSRSDGITVNLKASLGSKRIKSADENYYIVETESYGSGIDLSEPVAELGKTFDIDVNFSVDAGNGSDDTRQAVAIALMNKFALAVKNADGSYQVISTPMGISNPELIAEDKSAILVPISKKGIQAVTLDDRRDDGTPKPTDNNAYGSNTKHTLFNIMINDLIGTSEGNGFVAYEYKGKTYYFSNCAAEQEMVRNLVAGYPQYIKPNVTATNHVAVTFVLLLQYDSDAKHLIDPSARSKGHKYYTLNVREEAARETLEALFLYLGEIFGQEDCFVTHWVLGNEVNSSKAWNYQGSLSFSNYMKYYATAFRLLYNGVKAGKSGNNVYISLDNGWTAAPDTYSGKATLDKFASYAQQENKEMLWSIAYHGYSYPLTRNDFWNDSKNTTSSVNTKYISMKNISVLTNYAATLEEKYEKPAGSIRVILSEQGYNGSPNPTSQAKALARGYYMAEFNDRIDAFIIRAITDAKEETKGGLYLGITNGQQEKRIAYFVYEYMDSNLEYMGQLNPVKIVSSDNIGKFEIAQKILSETNWESIIPGFYYEKLAEMH